VRVQPVADATDPAPPADDAWNVAAQHDMDALPRQPATLVEAGLGPARLDRPHTQLEHGALRRRTLWRKLEENALAEPRLSEANDLRRRAERERGASNRSGDHDASVRTLADVACEHAAVESDLPQRAPPETDKCERESGEGETPKVAREESAGGRPAGGRKKDHPRKTQPH
jgi:hypothetical protein